MQAVFWVIVFVFMSGLAIRALQLWGGGSPKNSYNEAHKFFATQYGFQVEEVPDKRRTTHSGSYTYSGVRY